MFAGQDERADSYQELLKKIHSRVPASLNSSQKVSMNYCRKNFHSTAAQRTRRMGTLNDLFRVNSDFTEICLAIASADAFPVVP